MNEIPLSLTEQHRDSVLTPERVLEHLALYAPVTPDMNRMIPLYPNWKLEHLSPQQISQLTWYLDKDPNHISQFLTDQGGKRTVAAVARKFQDIERHEMLKIWDKADTVYKLIDCLEAGETLPPLVIVAGSRYPDSPECSFIDGVHRSLAMVVHANLHPESQTKVAAFVGNKASPFTRIAKKIF